MNDAKNHDSQQGMDAPGAKTKARRQPMTETSMQAYPESGGDQGNQDEISLAELWLKAKSVIAYLWRFKFLIMGVGLLFDEQHQRHCIGLGREFTQSPKDHVYSVNWQFQFNHAGIP